MTIRNATEADLPYILEIFREILEKGDTYTLPKNTPDEQLKEYWMGPEIKDKAKHYVTRVAEVDGKVAGVYAIRPCYPIGGPSAHVANASYIVHKEFQGRGIARQMGLESFEEAQKLGYTRMQYNQVISTNAAAVKVWEKLGFKVVGKSPDAFMHKDGTAADLLIMNRDLRSSL